MKEAKLAKLAKRRKLGDKAPFGITVPGDVAHF